MFSATDELMGLGLLSGWGVGVVKVSFGWEHETGTEEGEAGVGLGVSLAAGRNCLEDVFSAVAAWNHLLVI